MSRYRFFAILPCLGFFLVTCDDASEYSFTTTGGPEVIQFRALPFQLTQVELLDGPFRHAVELNVRSLLRYEPDRLLAKYRLAAGLAPKAEHYHGWSDYPNEPKDPND